MPHVALWPREESGNAAWCLMAQVNSSHAAWCLMAQVNSSHAAWCLMAIVRSTVMPHGALWLEY